MKDVNTLRILLISILGISVLQFLNFGIQLFSTVFSQPDNPLFPKYLWKYVAFPQFIISILFLAFGVFSYSSLRTKQYYVVVIWLVFFCSVLFIFIGPYVFEFINRFNPYA